MNFCKPSSISHICASSASQLLRKTYGCEKSSKLHGIVASFLQICASYKQSCQKMSANEKSLTRTDSSPFTAELIDDFYPLNEPLCAKYKKGFGYRTIGYRLPVILTKIIDQASRDKNDIGEKLGQDARAEVKDIVGGLAQLKNEMVTNKPLRSTGNPFWDEYVKKVATVCFEGDLDKVRWYMAPWLYVECYLYHRMNNVISSTKHLKSYDPFRMQKESSLIESIEACDVLGHYLESNRSNKDEILQIMLEVSLWGNRCDLSISGGESNSQNHNVVDSLETLRHNILANDSEKVWKSLGETTGAERSIGYVLDNAGFELFTDLCFADVLLEHGLADRIDFYVKTEPWFVSDALKNDVLWTLDMLGREERDVLSKLAGRWKGHFESGRFFIQERQFWTYPHAYYEMKEADPALYDELSGKRLLIFKGDLNYRKLINDTNWDFKTTFLKALQGFTPAPFVALRTLKADTVAGLPAGVGEELSRNDREWMVTGEYGLIQFAS